MRWPPKPLSTGIDVDAVMERLAGDARAAARALGAHGAEDKNRALRAAARRIRSSENALLAANARDLEVVDNARLTEAFVDRLKLTPAGSRPWRPGSRPWRRSTIRSET